MLMSEQDAATAGPVQTEAREVPMDAAARNLVYLEIRGRLRDGWDDLPEGLTTQNLRDLAAMAKSRNDYRIHTLCNDAALAQADGAPPQA